MPAPMVRFKISATDETAAKLNAYLQSSTLFWNLIVDHTRNDVTAYLEEPISHASSVAFSTRLAQITMQILNPTEAINDLIIPRWQRHLSTIRRLPHEELLNRLADMIMAFDGAKADIVEKGTKVSQAKFPRHKGKTSTKSVRLTPNSWRFSPDMTAIEIHIAPEVRIELYRPEQAQIKTLDLSKAYDMSITLRPGRPEEGFEHEDVYYLSFVPHDPLLY